MISKCSKRDKTYKGITGRTRGMLLRNREEEDNS